MHDLESRKRAPLYQKRQEEELRAALEKATEADARAHEAETVTYKHLTLPTKKEGKKMV